MRILVTGACGRLGHVVVGDLLGAGHEVAATDRRLDREIGIPIIGADLTKLAEVRLLMEKIDAVCHLGNYPGLSRDPIEAADGFANNAVINYNVFAAAVMAGIKKIVYASSIQAYGQGVVFFEEPAPHVPPLYLPVDEDHPRRPLSAYQLSKAHGEEIGEACCRRDRSLQVFSLRLTWIAENVPALQPEPPRDALAGSHGTFVYVKDAARAVRLCCEANRPGHTPLNIIARRPLFHWSEQMLIEHFGAVPPFRRKLRNDEPLLDWRRAKEIVGFEAE